MQRDQDLLAYYEQFNQLSPCLFFYTWASPSITVGRIQSNKDYIYSIANKHSIPVLERPSGGKAVLHGGDICYSFITNIQDSCFGGTMQVSFRAINFFIASLVNSVFQIQLIQEPSACKLHNADPNCFRHSIIGEALLQSNGLNHKIIGSAQRMGSQAILQQGSIQVFPAPISIPEFETCNLSEFIQLKSNLEEYCSELNQVANDALVQRGYVNVDVRQFVPHHFPC